MPGDTGTKDLWEIYSREVNKEYGWSIINHGDNLSGEIMGISNAINLEKFNSQVFIYNNKGYIGSGIYDDLLRSFGNAGR